jgi:hypothetical protein
MRLARPILTAVVVVALAGYGLDCSAMSTPEEAMQCCDSMPCPSQGPDHSQDCCKTMPSIQAPFVQPHSAAGALFTLVALALLPDVMASQDVDSSARVLFTALSHAPPIPQATPAPLRI